MSRLSSLASVSETKATLERFGLMTKKALGQHFLINDGVVARICSLADLSKEDQVVEIGPGIGTLTEALLKNAGNVVAIERDTDLPIVLSETCAPWKNTFTLISADALHITAADLPFAPNKLVANLPYAVAATLVLDYFERLASLESATVMVQAEVADRMNADVGTKSYGAYTVKLSLFAHTTGRFSVAESNFFPPPRVKSAVIRLDRNTEILDPKLLKATMIMADAAFENRRKTISNSMKRYFERIDPTIDVQTLLPQLFIEADVDPGSRGETLMTDAYLRLGRAFLALSNQ